MAKGLRLDMFGVHPGAALPWSSTSLPLLIGARAFLSNQVHRLDPVNRILPSLVKEVLGVDQRCIWLVEIRQTLRRHYGLVGCVRLGVQGWKGCGSRDLDGCPALALAARFFGTESEIRARASSGEFFGFERAWGRRGCGGRRRYGFGGRSHAVRSQVRDRTGRSSPKGCGRLGTTPFLPQTSRGESQGLLLVLLHGR